MIRVKIGPLALRRWSRQCDSESSALAPQAELNGLNSASELQVRDRTGFLSSRHRVMTGPDRTVILQLHCNVALALRNRIYTKAIQTTLAIPPATEKYFVHSLVDTHPIVTSRGTAAAEVLAEVHRRLHLCCRNVSMWHLQQAAARARFQPACRQR